MSRAVTLRYLLKAYVMSRDLLTDLSHRPGRSMTKQGQSLDHVTNLGCYAYLYGRSESTLGSDNPQIRKELSVPDPIRQLFPFIGKVILR